MTACRFSISGARALLLALAALLARPAAACDSNGCFQMTRGDGLLRKGQVRVDLSLRVTDQSDRRSGGSPTDSVRRPKVWLEGGYMWPGFHEEIDGRERFLQLDLAYGLGPRTSAFLSAPLSAKRSYTIGHGRVTQQYEPHGFGDTLLGVRHAFGRRLLAALAVKVPTGRHDLVDSYDGTILDPMLQPGTGSVDGFVSLSYGFNALERGLRFTAAASRQQSTADGYGYRFGSETIATLGVRRAVRGPLEAALQAKLFAKQRSSFLDQPVASTGGRFVYLTPGLHVRLPGSASAFVLAPVPVHRHVNEAQLAPRRGVVVGLQRTFR